MEAPVAEYATKQDLQEVIKPINERLDKLDNNVRAVLVQNEQKNSKLDAILELVQDAPAVKTRVRKLEENAIQEKAKADLDRLHLRELRRDLDDHKRQPHSSR
jgi:hypothetical protein